VENNLKPEIGNLNLNPAFLRAKIRGFHALITKIAKKFLAEGSNPANSGGHEMCSSSPNRFPRAYIADIRDVAPAVSGQTGAAVSWRYDYHRGRHTSKLRRRGDAHRAEVMVLEKSAGISPA
jgi:hypothetical protein